MGDLFIWAQVIGFCGMSIGIIAWQLKNSRHIIICYIPSRLLMATQYLMLGAPLGAIMDICSVFRDSGISFLKDKFAPYIIFTCLFSVWVIGLYFLQHWYDTLPLIAGTIANLALFHRKNRSLYARAAIISSFIWIIYNLFVYSWMGATAACFTITSSIIGMYRYEEWDLKSSPKLFLQCLFVLPKTQTKESTYV